jgi:hypothetical protein
VFGTRRDASRLGHMEEQAQVDQIKVHGGPSGRIAFVSS